MGLGGRVETAGGMLRRGSQKRGPGGFQEGPRRVQEASQEGRFPLVGFSGAASVLK